jgi:hypothetical protein
MHAYIYRIENNQTDEVYIGSTTLAPSVRWTKHKSVFNRNSGSCSSSILFQKYGIENCTMVVEEEIVADTREQVRQREREAMEWYGTRCVNKYRAYITREEMKQKLLENSRRFNKIKVLCEACNVECNYKNLWTHRKTKKCQKNMAEQSIQANDNIREPQDPDTTETH